MTKVSKRTAKLYADEREATIDLVKVLQADADEESSEILERVISELTEDVEHFRHIQTYTLV